MSQSHEMRLLLADNEAGTTNAISLAALDCDLIGDQVFGYDEGKRGTREEYACGARVLAEICGGGFNLRPTAVEMDWLLERMIGNRISTFPATPLVSAETLPQIYAFVDKGPENYLYHLLTPSRTVISGSEGQYLNWRQEYVGSKEVAGASWPGTPPAIDCDSQFIMSDVIFDLGGTEFPFKTFELAIDNRIADGQQENSLYRTIFESQGLSISLNMTFANRSDTIALYRRAIAGDAGSLALSDGADTYTFDFANVKIPTKGPTVPAQGEITMSLAMMIKRTVSTQALTVTKT